MSFKNNIICEEFSREMWRYLEDSFSGDEKSFWNKHLETCSTCRTALSEAEKGLSIYESLPLEDISDDRFEQIIQNAAGKSRLFSRRIQPLLFHFAYKRIAFSSAALAVTIAVIFIIYRPKTENSWKPGTNNAQTDISLNSEVNKGLGAEIENIPVKIIKNPESTHIKAEILEWKGERVKRKINQVGYSIDMIDEYKEWKVGAIDNWSMKASVLDKEIERLEIEIKNSSL